MMEFMDGVKKKETLGISQILEGDDDGVFLVEVFRG